MQVKKSFNSEVRLFEVDGIKMIGNGITSSLIGLTESGYDFVESLQQDKEAQLTAENQALYDEMTRQGYFISDADVVHYIPSAYVHVTDNCNLHCVGCYSYVCDRNKRNDFTLQDAYHIFDQLKSCNTRNIIISGGEPFMRPDIADICKYGKECGMMINVITNGTMPKSRYQEAFPYIDTIAISIDGYDTETSFIRDKGIMPRILETIEFVKQHIPTKLIVTLHRQNVPYMKEYYKFAESLHVPFSFSILTVAEDNQDFADYILRDDDYAKIEEYTKTQQVLIADTALESTGISFKTRCGAGMRLVSIGADGSVYPCHMLHQDELVLGNIFDGELSDIVFSENNAFNTFDVDRVPKCSACNYKFLCGGGCRARSVIKNCGIYGLSDVCDMNLNFIRDRLYAIKSAL